MIVFAHELVAKLYRRVKLLGVALYYIIYRSRDPNLCRAKR